MDSTIYAEVETMKHTALVKQCAGLTPMLSPLASVKSDPASDANPVSNEPKKPLAIDLFCGLGGWTEGLLAEGYEVIGFDIERRPYPAQLVLQDVLTLHGSQFKDAALIVASPPCQAYSYRAMPWKRAKALPPPDNYLFNACFRIQREACDAAGRYIPLIVENVQGAQKWVGRAKWHFGSYYLWGDVPALMVVGQGLKRFGGTWFEGRSYNRWDPEVRKAASALSAKIPFPLARHIARVYKPVLSLESSR